MSDHIKIGSSHEFPETMTMQSKKHPDMRMKDRNIDDVVKLVVTGKVTDISRNIHDDDKPMSMTIEIQSIEDKSPRSGLDEDGRIR